MSHRGNMVMIRLEYWGTSHPFSLGGRSRSVHHSPSLRLAVQERSRGHLEESALSRDYLTHITQGSPAKLEIRSG